jgi:hypothetical protein
MAIRSSVESTPSAKLGIIAAVALLIIVAGAGALVAGCGSQPAVAPPVASADPNAKWVHDKAMECQGDMSKLSQADQVKLESLYGLPGAPSTIANEYRVAKGP